MDHPVVAARRSLRPLWPTVVLMGLPFAIAAYFVRHVNVSALLMNLALVPVFLVGGTILHEAAHALVARATGMSVWLVVVGRGPVWRSGTWRGVPWVLQRVPLTGLTRFSPAAIEGLRWRFVLTGFAGPGVHLALLLLALPFTSSVLSLVRVFSPMDTLFWVQALALYVNVVPVRNRSPEKAGGSRGTDGWFVLDAIRMPMALRERLVADHLAQTALATMKRERSYRNAIPDLRRALALAPERDGVAYALGEALLLEHQYAEALPLLDRGLGLPMKDQVRASICNSVAWAVAMVEQSDRYEAAEALCAEALAILPESAACIGTRGTLRLARSALDLAQPDLEYALADQKPDTANGAESALLMAELWAARGERVKAEEMLERAKAYVGVAELPLWGRASGRVLAIPGESSEIGEVREVARPTEPPHQTVGTP